MLKIRLIYTSTYLSFGSEYILGDQLHDAHYIEENKENARSIIGHHIYDKT